MRKMILSASALVLGLAAGSVSADSNKLFIEQVGSNNFVDGNQSGVVNQTFAVQNGNYNTGNAATNFTSGSNNNRALLKQDGNRNIGGWSSQSGTPAFSNNTIGIVQDTNQNFAYLNNQGGPTTNSEIFIEQTGGNGNYVGNGASVTSASGNGASNGATLAFTNPGVDNSLIEGGSSVFNVPVTASDSNARVHGNNNSVGVIQDGAANALALNVVGNDNRVGGDGMTGSVDLNSFTNSGNFFSGMSTVDTTGAYTPGIASQDGNDNTGVIAIAGNSNAVSFSQYGNNNVGEVYVGGNGNLAVANQY